MLTLIIAILFTLAAIGSLFYRRGSYWWLAPLVFTAGAIINWLRYFGMMG